MRSLYAGFLGALAIAAAAEASPFHPAPRPWCWLAVIAAVPLASRALGWISPRRLVCAVPVSAFLIAYSIILYPFGWADAVLLDLGWRGKPFCALSLLLAPAAALAFCLWLPACRREARDRGTATARVLAGGLRMKARALIGPAVIVFGTIGAAEALSASPAVADAFETHAALRIAALAAGLSVLLALSPFLILASLPTVPFPPGPLRERLLRAAAELGAGNPWIRVWNGTGGATVNACAVGLLPGVRAVIFTRGTLECFGEDEVLGVFAHEAAHLGRRHILVYAALALGFILAMAPLDGLTSSFPDAVRTPGLAALLGALGGLVLGRVSRRLEVDADVAAGCISGFEGLASALERTARLHGADPEHRGWRHPSVGERARTLRAVASDPRRLEVEQRAFRRLAARSCALLAMAALACGITAAVEAARSEASSAAAAAWAALGRAQESAAVLEHDVRSDVEAIRFLARDRATLEHEARDVIATARSRVEACERMGTPEAPALREAFGRL